jgi:hypothetical protein
VLTFATQNVTDPWCDQSTGRVLSWKLSVGLAPSPWLAGHPSSCLPLFPAVLSEASLFLHQDTQRDKTDLTSGQQAGIWLSSCPVEVPGPQVPLLPPEKATQSAKALKFISVFFLSQHMLERGLEFGEGETKEEGSFGFHECSSLLESLWGFGWPPERQKHAGVCTAQRHLAGEESWGLTSTWARWLSPVPGRGVPSFN